MDRGHDAPARSRGDLLRQMACVGHIPPQPFLEPGHALFADSEPELERPKAASQRNAPIAEVLDLAVHRGLQIAGIRRHHAHQMFGVADIVERAVERRSQPFVRIDHQTVGAVDPLPHPAAFGQDHRAARHRSIHMQPNAVSSCDLGDGRDWINRCRCGGAHGRHDGAREIAPREVRGHHLRQRVRAHREIVVKRNLAYVVPSEAGQHRALFHRAVCMRGHVDARLAGLALQAAARQRISRSLARAR